MIPIESIKQDRLAIVGTSGSGKSYFAMSAVEQLMTLGRRVIIVDPLGVWFGLRLMPDGSPSPYRPVIFGGNHGDIAITENSGQIIGEAVATSADSCIIDLSQFGVSAVERRFMLAFLKALYAKTAGTPVHLVLDEADMWAPQVINDRDGDSAKLLGMMETVVRRGRVKGFVPWMITQRPAVLNKNVMSQADGLVAMKLTSSQDRSAIGAWVEGQADKGQWKEISAELPTLKRGTGVVWLPSRGILETMTFGKKLTFDSSRTPEHGEKVANVILKPVDIGALRDRLASVEQETKNNDPKALKAEIARLKSERQKQPVAVTNGFTQSDIDAAERRGKEIAVNSFSKFVQEAVGSLEQVEDRLQSTRRALDSLALFSSSLAGDIAKPPKLPNPVARTASGHTVDGRGIAPDKAAPPHSEFSGPKRRILKSLNFWHEIGHATPSRQQIALVAGYSPNGSAFSKPLGELRGEGHVLFPSPGTARAVTSTNENIGNAHAVIRSVLTGPQLRILDAVLVQDGDRQSIADRANYSLDGSAFSKPLGELRKLGLVYFPQLGQVAATDWARQVLA